MIFTYENNQYDILVIQYKKDIMIPEVNIARVHPVVKFLQESIGGKPLFSFRSDRTNLRDVSTLDELTQIIRVHLPQTTTINQFLINRYGLEIETTVFGEHFLRR